MTINELIKHLENLKNVCGDITVHIDNIYGNIKTFEIRESKYLDCSNFGNTTFPKQQYLILHS